VTVLGGIETGGSKWECAVGTGPDDLTATETIPTTSPDETLGRAASFGPIDQDRSSPTWGYITTTPKPGWADTDVAQQLGRRLGVPIAFDTDVNAAALGEYRWGAAQGLETVCYITVGTGIGGGVVLAGRPLHGLLHPEFGHLRVPHDRDADPFDGVCPFHGDCWEGLAAGPAIAARWGKPAEELDDVDAVWQLEARYLALGLVSVISIISPERIVIGGGVMNASKLLSIVRDEVAELVNGYPPVPALGLGIADYIVRPALGRRAGVLGAIALASEL
jgi:fructokinase